MQRIAALGAHWLHSRRRAETRDPHGDEALTLRLKRRDPVRLRRLASGPWWLDGARRCVRAADRCCDFGTRLGMNPHRHADQERGHEHEEDQLQSKRAFHDRLRRCVPAHAWRRKSPWPRRAPASPRWGTEVPRDQRAANGVQITCPTRGIQPQGLSLDSDTRHMCQRVWSACPQRHGLDSAEACRVTGH